MTDEYHLTRMDLGGSQRIYIFDDPDVPHVCADWSVPLWKVDALVRAKLIRKLVERYRAEHPEPVERPLLRMPQRRQGLITALLRDREFLGTADTHTIMDTIVRAAILDADADLSDLQIVDPITGSLEIRAYCGFAPEVMETFRIVKPGDPTACALALTTGKPIMVQDIARSPVFAPCGLTVYHPVKPLLCKGFRPPG